MGLWIILGGILPTLPGFITDVIGALLLLGPVRIGASWRFAAS
jgi:UPF0716 family protein affecting phage T7 exclusion